MFPQQPELSVPAVVGLVLAALVVDLATLLVLARLAGRYGRRSRPSPDAGGEDGWSDTEAGVSADAPDGSVACPACGAANEPGYRYCRACVARLPGRASETRSELPSFGRFAD